MADTSLKLRCQTRSGLKMVEGLNSNSTIADLLLKVSQATSIPSANLIIKFGFPPQSLDITDIHQSLSDLKVRSGDKIIIDEEASPVHQEKERGCADELLQHQLARSKGLLQRRVVPADNSCLFTAVHTLMTDGVVDVSNAGKLRQVIAKVVSTDPDTYSEAILGRPNKEYVRWIMNSDSWGGGIELAILSEHFLTEIAVVDCQSARIDRFGEDKNYPRRIFLLYDGVHYDPLLLEAADGTGNVLETRFLTTDTDTLLQAMDIAREAQSSRQFTDVTEFTLQCLICRTPLKGQHEAQQHAISTGHDKYGECSSGL